MLPHQDTHDQLASQPLHEGMAVFDRDGEKIGTLKQQELRDGYLLVHHGWLFGHDLSVPEEVVARVDATGIHLNVPKQTLEHPSADALAGGAEPLPSEQLDKTTPLVPPQRLDTDPLAGEKAPATEAASALHAHVDPMVDQAGHVTDQARQRVEQVAGQVGDLVQQTREQASAVASQVADRVGHAAEQVRQAAAELAANRLTDAAERLARIVPMLTQLGEQLRQRDNAALAKDTANEAASVDELAALPRMEDNGLGGQS